MTELCGVINVYKEKGYTSHDVVNIVRNSLNKVKTGHTGTLDPDAEGVLPICIGRATKLAGYISSERKTYKAELTLGISTSTQDKSGEIIRECKVEASRDEIISAAEGFVGEIKQVPPMYSAVKVGGKRLYEIARAGGEIERKERNVTIYGIRIEKFIDDKTLIMNVECSKGTYIRTLCSDIGDKLGCGGHMSALTRTRSGSFRLENAVKINYIKELAKEGRIEDIIMSPEMVLPDFRKIYVSEAAGKYMKNGNKLSLNYVQDDIVPKENEVFFVCGMDKALHGLYRVKDGFLKPEVILHLR